MSYADIDCKTKVWMDDFNVLLKEHRLGKTMSGLTFKPPSDSGLLNRDDFPGIPKKPLMVLDYSKSYKYIYIACLIALALALLVGIYLLISAGLFGLTSYKQMIIPITLIIFLVPSSLVFGLPSYFYLGRRQVLIFSDHLAFTWRSFKGTYKPYRQLYYKALREVEVSYEFNDNGRYWTYTMTFKRALGYALSDIRYRDVQAKMTFWQNNMVWLEPESGAP